MKAKKTVKNGLFSAIWKPLVMVSLLSFMAVSCSSNSDGTATTPEPLECETDLIETTSGRVCGRVEMANQKEVHAFLGIPLRRIHRR